MGSGNLLIVTEGYVGSCIGRFEGGVIKLDEVIEVIPFDRFLISSIDLEGIKPKKYYKFPGLGLHILVEQEEPKRRDIKVRSTFFSRNSVGYEIEELENHMLGTFDFKTMTEMLRSNNNLVLIKDLQFPKVVYVWIFREYGEENINFEGLHLFGAPSGWGDGNRSGLFDNLFLLPLPNIDSYGKVCGNFAQLSGERIGNFINKTRKSFWEETTFNNDLRQNFDWYLNNGKFIRGMFSWKHFSDVFPEFYKEENWLSSINSIKKTIDIYRGETYPHPHHILSRSSDRLGGVKEINSLNIGSGTFYTGQPIIWENKRCRINKILLLRSNPFLDHKKVLQIISEAEETFEIELTPENEKLLFEGINFEEEIDELKINNGIDGEITIKKGNVYSASTTRGRGEEIFRILGIVSRSWGMPIYEIITRDKRYLLSNLQDIREYQSLPLKDFEGKKKINPGDEVYLISGVETHLLSAKYVEEVIEGHVAHAFLLDGSEEIYEERDPLIIKKEDVRKIPIFSVNGRIYTSALSYNTTSGRRFGIVTNSPPSNSHNLSLLLAEEQKIFHMMGYVDLSVGKKLIIPDWGLINRTPRLGIFREKIIKSFSFSEGYIWLETVCEEKLPIISNNGYLALNVFPFLDPKDFGIQGSFYSTGKRLVKIIGVTRIGEGEGGGILVVLFEDNSYMELEEFKRKSRIQTRFPEDYNPTPKIPKLVPGDFVIRVFGERKIGIVSSKSTVRTIGDWYPEYPRYFRIYGIPLPYQQRKFVDWKEGGGIVIGRTSKTVEVKDVALSPFPENMSYGKITEGFDELPTNLKVCQNLVR